MLKLSNEVELIVRIPIELNDDLERYSKLAGYKNSCELIARFIKRQLAMFLNINENDSKLNNIH